MNFLFPMSHATKIHYCHLKFTKQNIVDFRVHVHMILSILYHEKEYKRLMLDSERNSCNI